jgi:hypothetical protein
MNNNYYDCKLIINCFDGQLQHLGYRNKLCKSNLIDSIFKKNECKVERTNSELFLVYSFDSPFTKEINSKILDSVSKDLVLDYCQKEYIEAIMHYEFINDDICLNLLNNFDKFEINIQKKIKQFFKNNKNSVGSEMINRLKQITEVKRYCDFQLNDNIVKLTLRNGEIYEELIPKKIKKKIVDKYADLHFNIISGEENDTRRTMGQLINTDFDKLELTELILICSNGTKIYNSKDIINEDVEFIELSMSNISSVEIKNLKTYYAIVTFKKLEKPKIYRNY